ncbi:ac81-like protein [Peridroma alphabaculovirus]|uniref:Ac81-like protein n=1 Tax=Peridroma alphabaculovirus TaxID=1346829 RepID=A0A068LKP0_9ABAC|nr:ac81-like protein [Peridroma alphabaculovirus]AIE47867.1 ac81-like protein [Peridroma alphabaculovirus]
MTPPPAPTMTRPPLPQPTTCLPSQCQPNDKNLTTNKRIKYDPELLLHYLFDNINRSDNTNLIRVCKVRVKKTCGTMLAHYYAHITISNGYSFEFHPGSQPRTFQIVHSDGFPMLVMVQCDECCKKELVQFVEGENSFNVAFKNCESILCKRNSMQTVLIVMALAVIVANMFRFSWYYIFFVIFVLFLLYMNNNYMISDPHIVYCPHKQILKHDPAAAHKQRRGASQ